MYKMSELMDHSYSLECHLLQRLAYFCLETLSLKETDHVNIFYLYKVNEKDK